MPMTHERLMKLKPTEYHEFCQKQLYLVKQQQEICYSNLSILHSISRGAKMGIDECQYQFQASRWNCSTIDETSTDAFGGVLASRSREKAYLYAISTAGIAYSVTKACATGQLKECHCDEKIKDRDTNGRWQWAGCSDDIRYGSSFSKDFVDAGEDENTPHGLMNIHNNEAGRRVS